MSKPLISQVLFGSIQLIGNQVPPLDFVEGSPAAATPRGATRREPLCPSL